MTWDILAPTTSAYSPMARFASEMQERGGSYAYPGWAAYKGGITKSSSNAALSALTLLSFLFFLNLLQQQLTSGQQQTLLFMVNNTAPVNREGKHMDGVGKSQPLEAAGGMVHDLHENIAVKTPRNGKKARGRKVRDLREDTFDNYRRHASPANQHFENYVQGETSTVRSPAAPKPLAAPPIQEVPPPVMMEGLQSGSTLQLSAWLKGQLSADQLRADLADTLTNCRAVVACTVYQSSTTEASNNATNQERVRKLLKEAGEYAEPGHIDDACKSLLLSAGEDCGALAQSFAFLLQ